MSAGMHNAAGAGWQRPATPDPRSPDIPSSILTKGFSTGGFSVGSTDTPTSLLTVPDEKEEENGMVTGIAVRNPFAVLPGSGHDRAVVEESSMSVSKAVTLEDDLSDLSGLPAVSEVGNILEVKVARFAATSNREEPPAELRTDQSRGFEGEESSEDASGGEGEDLQVEDTEMSDSSGDVDHEETDKIKETADHEVSSDWVGLEEVQKRLDGYEDFKKSILGHEKWTEAQAKLHKLLSLRGALPMLERDWAFHFKNRNIYPWVYAQEGSEERVTITAKSDEFRAAKALEDLFDLSSLICSYCQAGMQPKISRVLSKALHRYISWAMYDAGVDHRSYIPVFEVHEFDPHRWGPRVMKAEPNFDDENDSDSEIDTETITAEFTRRIQDLAARHRKQLVTSESRHLPEAQWTYELTPPVLFAFVVVQHMVMLISLDSSRPDNEAIFFAHIDMSQADQWLWNALALALPVHMARDVLWERREWMRQVEFMDIDDPDV